MRKKYNFSLFYRLFFIFAITVYSSCNLNQPNTTDFKTKINPKEQIKSFRTKNVNDRFYLETTLYRAYVAFNSYNYQVNQYPQTFHNPLGTTEISDVTIHFPLGDSSHGFTIQVPGAGYGFSYDIKVKKNESIIYQTSLNIQADTPGYPYGGFMLVSNSQNSFTYYYKSINLSLTNTEISTNAPSSTINVNPTNIDSPWTVTIIGNNDFFVTKTGTGQQNIDFSESGLGKKLNAGEYTITARFDDQAESLESLIITKVGGAAIITKDFYSPYGDAKYSA
ncbi:MAG: hypothetical protein AABZ74_06500, partial [Cyanobacteriota bacterium]